jgi:hypothetical protein
MTKKMLTKKQTNLLSTLRACNGSNTHKIAEHRGDFQAYESTLRDRLFRLAEKGLVGIWPKIDNQLLKGFEKCKNAAIHTHQSRAQNAKPYSVSTVVKIQTCMKAGLITGISSRAQTAGMIWRKYEKTTYSQSI